MKVRVEELEQELGEGRRLETEFSNFDLGLDSLLRAPLDVLNLQIDNILNQR